MDINSIENKEEKLVLAKKIAQKVKDGQTIGFGSGSTSYLAAIEIGKLTMEYGYKITAIPTSNEIEEVCKKYNINVGNLLENDIDWCFDGADEVDENKNMIKGMGRAMFKEKLNIISSGFIRSKSPINTISIPPTKCEYLAYLLDTPVNLSVVIAIIKINKSSIKKKKI